MLYQVLQSSIPWCGFLYWPYCMYLITHGCTPQALVSILLGVFVQTQDLPDCAHRIYHAIIRSGLEILIVQEPPTELTYTAREIVLMVPHGLLCVETAAAMSEWISRSQERTYTCFIDQKLYAMSPLASMMTKLVGATSVDTCRHASIQRVLQETDRGESLCVFPGGFVEAVGGTSTTQYIHTATYGYWIKQSQAYNIPLRILHVYNGSAMFPQSAVNIERRLHYARVYQCPVILPVGIRRVQKLLARTWVYQPTESGITVQTIEQDMFSYLALDRKHPAFEQGGNSPNGFPTVFQLTSKV